MDTKKLHINLLSSYMGILNESEPYKLPSLQAMNEILPLELKSSLIKSIQMGNSSLLGEYSEEYIMDILTQYIDNCFYRSYEQMEDRFFIIPSITRYAIFIHALDDISLRELEQMIFINTPEGGWEGDFITYCDSIYFRLFPDPFWEDILPEKDRNAMMEICEIFQDFKKKINLEKVTDKVKFNLHKILEGYTPLIEFCYNWEASLKEGTYNEKAISLCWEAIKIYNR